MAFLSMIIKEQYETNLFYAIVPILLIMLSMLFSFKYSNLHEKKEVYGEISVALWLPIGAIFCYVLSIHANLGSVLAAGITGTLASFLPLINKKSIYFQKLPATIYCGSFVGMSSVVVAPSISFVILAGILAGIFFILSKNLFVGIGGKLGTIAFGGVVMASLIFFLLK